MATYLKVLGQQNPAANTYTILYAVPANNTAVVSTIVLCNTGAAATNASIAIQPGNAAIATKHYIVRNTSVPANDTITLTLGIGLAATDVVSANIATSNLAVSVFGTEVY